MWATRYKIAVKSFFPQSYAGFLTKRYPRSFWILRLGTQNKKIKLVTRISISVINRLRSWRFLTTYFSKIWKFNGFQVIFNTGTDFERYIKLWLQFVKRFWNYNVLCDDGFFLFFFRIFFIFYIRLINSIAVKIRKRKKI